MAVKFEGQMSKKKFTKLDLSGGFVWSTNPDFKAPEDEQEAQERSPGEQQLKIWFEKKGRGGKTASVVKDFVGTEEALNELAKVLKSKCATGGNAKDGEIVLQGDVRQKAKVVLESLGYKVKLAGG